MKHRHLLSAAAATLTLAFAVALLLPSPAAGQHVLKSGEAAVEIAGNKAPAKPYVVKKTPDGVPDLQGYWTNNTIIPLERPNGVTKEYYTPDEARAAAKRQADRDEEQTTPGTTADVHYDFTQFGLDKSQTVLTGNLRTSIITTPANGKIPPVTPQGQKRAAEAAAARPKPSEQYDKVQNIVIGSRCIYQGAGPPMLPPGYNPGYQIV